MSQITKVVFAFAGVFVAGALAGGIVGLRLRMDAEQPVKQNAAGQTPPPPAKVVTVTPDNFSVMQMQQFTRQLSLTAEQKEKIQPIINATSEKINKLSQESRVATMALRGDMEKEISSLLTEEQRKKLSEIQTKRQAQFNANKPPSYSGRRGGPPDARPNGMRRGGGSATDRPPAPNAPAAAPAPAGQVP